MDWIYSLAQPFVWHPARALVVGLALALLSLGFRHRGRGFLLLGAAAWGVFALLEFFAWRERADIRVDLLLTWPALCLITVGCLLAWARQLMKPPIARMGR